MKQLIRLNVSLAALFLSCASIEPQVPTCGTDEECARWYCDENAEECEATYLEDLTREADNRGASYDEYE